MQHGRSVTKLGMKHDSHRPQRAIAPQRHTACADSVRPTCEPASRLPVTQRYFLF